MRRRIAAAVLAVAGLGALATPAAAETAPTPVWTGPRVTAGLASAWTATGQNANAFTPQETAGVVASTDVDGDLQGRNLETGRLLWTVPADGPNVIEWAQAAVDGRFFVSTNATVSAVDALTGATLWSYSAPSLRWLEGADAERVYVSEEMGVVALDAATGALLWQRGDIPDQDANARYGQVYALRTSGPSGASLLDRLDPATGATLWEVTLPDGALYEPLPLPQGGVMVETYQSEPPTYHAYDGNGAPVWSQPTPWPYGAYTVAPDGVVYGADYPQGDTLVGALDTVAGTLRWVTSDGFTPTLSGAATQSGQVALTPGAVFGDCTLPAYAGQGYAPPFVCAFDPATGNPLTVVYTGPAGTLEPPPPTVAGDRLLTLTGGTLTAFTPGTPHPLPGKVEAESTISPDFTATAQDTGGGRLVGLFPAGGAILDYPVSVPAAGTYTVTFRVASDGASLSPPISPKLQLQVLGVGTVATVDVPQTGGWQTWQSVTATVTLPAGIHGLRIYVPAGNQAFNINWFDVEHSTLARAARALPHTTAAQRRAACLAGVKPSTQLSAARIAADCSGA